MEPALDNPIWNALTGEQIGFAERDGDAARFAPEVTALAGLGAPGGIAGLARLIRPGEVAGLFVDGPPRLPPSLAIADRAIVAQMVHDASAPAAPDGVEELGPADAPAMRALAAATRPGPFGARTHELGTFLGVREGERLVAMAGQRLRLPGLIEVSAVCTHPDRAGRGLAARLMEAQLALVAAAGARAMLHVRGDNARAIALYERLGFVREGVKRRARKLGGDYDDDVIMALLT